MAKRSHVPKFGDWDGENVPDTAYFEGAREEKGAGIKMINPNDAEQNPDLFMPETSNPAMMKSNDYGTHYVLHGASPSDKSSEMEFNSHRSNSDYSIDRSGHRRPQTNKSPRESSYSFSPSPQPQKNRPKSANRPRPDTHQRAASVPKFGAWNESDPQSGEGYTVIFSKVKEEKHGSAVKLPMVQNEPTVYSDGYKKKSSSSKFKCGSCFSSSADH